MRLTVGDSFADSRLKFHTALNTIPDFLHEDAITAQFVAAIQQLARRTVVNVVAVDEKVHGLRRPLKCVRQVQYLMIRPFLMPIVKDIEFRSGDTNQSIVIDNLTMAELPVVELSQIPEHPQRHVGIPRTLMFHQDDIAIANAETDVVFNIVVEHTAQCRDTDIP